MFSEFLKLNCERGVTALNTVMLMAIMCLMMLTTLSNMSTEMDETLVIAACAIGGGTSETYGFVKEPEGPCDFPDENPP